MNRNPTRTSTSSQNANRRGATLVLAAMLLVVLLGLLAFTIDLGYITLVRGQLQNSADSAALAAASQLLDRDLLQGTTTQSLDEADAEAARFAAANFAGGVSPQLGNNDVVYGYIANPRDPSSPFDTSRTPYNSARVTVQRTAAQNGELGLFFARIFNSDSTSLSATATATYDGTIKGFEFTAPNQKSKLLPFAMSADAWEASFVTGSDLYTRDPETGEVTSGGDGIREAKLFAEKTAAGNWGTVNIGASNNSTSDIARQILHGPSPEDFDAIGGKLELEFDDKLELGADSTLQLEGDPGISAGVKDELATIIGQPRIIPIYTSVTENGNNTRYLIVGFVGCTIVKVQLTGGDKHILVQPEFVIDPTAQGGGSSSEHSFVFQPVRLSR